MGGFNIRMQTFRESVEKIGLKFYMWPYWFRYQNTRFKQSYWPAYLACDDKKSKTQILKELVSLGFHWKCLPYHYFRYGLYKRKFSYDKILDFVPETVVYNRLLPRLNSNYFLLDNKNTFESILANSSIKMPKTLFKIENGMVLDSKQNHISTQKEVDSILKEVKTDIVVKPADCGSGGAQIMVFSNKAQKFIYNGKKLDIKGLRALSKKDWIIQESVANSGFLKRIHPSSLNTFRVMTFLHPLKGPEVLYAILKAGNNNAATDNAHTGGIYVGVDINEHKLMNTGFDEDLNEFQLHPHTKVDFGRARIDGFEKVVDAAKRAALIFPTLRFVGWDIALTSNGAIIIEGNSSPGLTIIQRTYGGLKRFYDISNEFIKNKY